MSLHSHLFNSGGMWRDGLWLIFFSINSNFLSQMVPRLHPRFSSPKRVFPFSPQGSPIIPQISTFRFPSNDKLHRKAISPHSLLCASEEATQNLACFPAGMCHRHAVFCFCGALGHDTIQLVSLPQCNKDAPVSRAFLVSA